MFSTITGNLDSLQERWGALINSPLCGLLGGSVMAEDPFETLFRQRRRILLRKRDEDLAVVWANFYLSLWDVNGDYRTTGLIFDEFHHVLLYFSCEHFDSHIVSFARDILNQWAQGGDPRRDLKYAHGDPFMLTVSDLFKWATSSPVLQKERVERLINSVIQCLEIESEEVVGFLNEDGLEDQVEILRAGFDQEYQELALLLSAFLRWKIDSHQFPPFQELADAAEADSENVTDDLEDEDDPSLEEESG